MVETSKCIECEYLSFNFSINEHICIQRVRKGEILRLLDMCPEIEKNNERVMKIMSEKIQYHKDINYESLEEEENNFDGGSNNFYKFPANVTDIDSLARYWKLSFAEGNILKSLAANLGSRHDGTNPKREKKKALHYAVDRLIEHGISRNEIENQVITQLDKQF